MSYVAVAPMLLLPMLLRVSSASGDASLLVQSSVLTTPDKPPVVTNKEASSLIGAESSEVDVSELVSKPEAVFNMMDKQVGTLGEEMNRVHQENLESLANEERAFEAKLAEQRHHNAEIRASNDNLLNDINKLTTTNRQLWQRGKDLQAESDRQREAVKTMQAKIANAAEFAALQMKELADVDDPEEKVLRELDSLDSAHLSDSAHKMDLEKIAELGKKPPLGLLAIGGVSSPSSLLKSMEEGLAHLNAEQKESEDKLKAIFADKFATEALEHKALTEEGVRLEAKKKVLTDMHARLMKAVEHLEEVVGGLKKTILALGSFSEKVGKDSLDAQTVGEKKVALTDVGAGMTIAKHSDKESPSVSAPAAGWFSRTWKRLAGH